MVTGILRDDTHPTMSVQQSRTAIEDLDGARVHTDTVANDQYRVVPGPAKPGAPCWRIELWFDNMDLPPLRYEITGEVVMGRSDDVAINLSRYDHGSYGISRRHAMLRPSRGGLYFFDLESKNGTRHNGVSLSNAARTLALNDRITLGRLGLTVRRIERVE